MHSWWKTGLCVLSSANWLNWNSPTCQYCRGRNSESDAGLAPGNVIDLNGERSSERSSSAGAPAGTSKELPIRRRPFAAPPPALTDTRVEVFVSEDFDARPSAADDSPISEMFSLMQEGSSTS